MVRRFRRSAEAASAVRGPGVAPVVRGPGVAPVPGYDLGGPVPWIAAAYPAGPTPDEAVTEYGVFAEAGARTLPTEPDGAVAVIHEAGLACRG